jgi:toxin-antitoxin system PIN domain toxin
MTRYSKSFLFPDLNVWVALSYTKHIHYDCARSWYKALPEDAQLFFCRVTQISFLRLLTTQAVMGDDVLSQSGAWRLYDDWMQEGGASYIEEPPAVEVVFRSFTQTRNLAPKDWTDSYLAAFASASDLMLVTFDRGFQGKINQRLILRP